jgi:hypothetical protein
MRKVRMLFGGVNTVSKLLEVLTCLEQLGKLHRHNFNFQEAGFGEAVLCTDHEARHLEQQLGSLSSRMMTGVEDLKEEDCHDCQTMAA